MITKNNINIATSYFYQIRNFKPGMIPVSTCLSDPMWYRPPEGKQWYIDKRGVVCGLRYEPLIVQRYGNCSCPCLYKNELGGECQTMQEYRQLLEQYVNKEETFKAFEHCLNLFNADTIVLIVYETPMNLCSERKALQDFFNCKELEYPIR